LAMRRNEQCAYDLFPSAHFTFPSGCTYQPFSADQRNPRIVGHRGYESVIRNLSSVKVSARDSRAETIFALLHLVKIMSEI
jgi:hypothetical protein